MTSGGPVGDSQTLAGSPPALDARGISKTYAGVRVLDGVDLSIGRGEVHCLLGGNGSGKSTLVKALAGVIDADAGGEFVVGGDVVAAGDMTADLARRHHVYFVHQHSALFGDLSIAENLALGSPLPTTPWGTVRRSAMTRHARAVLRRFDIAAEPGDLVQSLRPSAQTMVAIARALQHSEEANSLLVLDEPTASLPRAEVNFLLDTLRQCADRGQAILFITHHLDEVMRLADRCTILRDGTVSATLVRGEFDHATLVTHVAGRELVAHKARAAHPEERETVLEVRDLQVGPLTQMSFTVGRSEIVGLAGLLGSGRSTMLRSLFGLVRPTSGTVLLDGRPFEPSSPAAAMERGVALVPEDRANDGTFADLSLAENIVIGDLGAVSRAGTVSRSRVRTLAEQVTRDFGVRAHSGPTQLMYRLSGGNQQKAVLARWILRRPTLLLLDEPTQGVDVGARAELYEVVRTAAAEGAAVFVVSVDFEELASLCDRVLVLRQGQIAGVLQGDDLTAQSISRHTF